MCSGVQRWKVKRVTRIAFILLLFIATIGGLCWIFYSRENIACVDFEGTDEEAARIVKNVTRCLDKWPYYKQEYRVDFLVLYNYLASTKRFKCEQSVTYVTHGDYTFLNNLHVIVDRWKGPVSIALHAPGDDFRPTLNSVLYLRKCLPLIKQFVTFHIYFNGTYAPDEIPLPNELSDSSIDCSTPAPYENVKREQMFITKNSILYPINVGRNIARSMAETHYILVSDIELYPSLDMIPKFLKMVAGCTKQIDKYKPAVFALNVFEVKENVKVPDNKSNLLKLLKQELAFPFHQDICSQCHSVPKYFEWKADTHYNGLKIFHISRRTGKYYHWEPFYLGTNEEPSFDERLTWNGMSDKVVQAYNMCLMNYSFFILDNAFLVHSPGIKVINPDEKKQRKKLVDETDTLIAKVIVPELKKTYGDMYGCEL